MLNDGDAARVMIKASPERDWITMERFETYDEAVATARRLAKLRARGMFFPLYAAISRDDENFEGRIF